MMNASSTRDNTATNDCGYVTPSTNITYQEISCLYPSLLERSLYYTKWEQRYDPLPVLQWMQSNSMIPWIACGVYLLGIFGGQYVMKSYPSWKWKNALALWNLLLCLFSTLGMIRTLPQLIHNLFTASIRDNVCKDPLQWYGCGSTGLWIQLFVLSKFPELIDTFFIVIHKKKLIFLHWYHHITVLLYCWHSYVTLSPVGIFFVVMNYSVHASMYGYYFMMAIHYKPKWFHPMAVTTFQISQMVVGVLVTLIGFYYYKMDSSCHITAENNTAAFVMYGSYLFLFLQFFIGRYVEPKVTFGPSKTAASTPTRKAKKLV